MKSNRIFIAWLRWPLYLRIAIIICFLLLFFGQLIVLLEPKQYHTIFDGIWWALITVSTVGYGDFVPQTMPGQVAGMALILSEPALSPLISPHLLPLCSASSTIMLRAR